MGLAPAAVVVGADEDHADVELALDGLRQLHAAGDSRAGVFILCCDEWGRADPDSARQQRAGKCDARELCPRLPSSSDRSLLVHPPGSTKPRPRSSRRYASRQLESGPVRQHSGTHSAPSCMPDSCVRPPLAAGRDGQPQRAVGHSRVSRAELRVCRAARGSAGRATRPGWRRPRPGRRAGCWRSRSSADPRSGRHWSAAASESMPRMRPTEARSPRGSCGGTTIRLPRRCQWPAPGAASAALQPEFHDLMASVKTLDGMLDHGDARRQSPRGRRSRGDEELKSRRDAPRASSGR